MFTIPLYYFLFLHAFFLLVFFVFLFINISHLAHTGAFTFISYSFTFLILILSVITLLATWQALLGTNWNQPITLFNTEWIKHIFTF